MKVISTSENKWGQIVLFAVMCIIFHATAPGKLLLIMSFLVAGLEEKFSQGNGPRVTWTCFVLLFHKDCHFICVSTFFKKKKKKSPLFFPTSIVFKFCSFKSQQSIKTRLIRTEGEIVLDNWRAKKKTHIFFHKFCL